MPCEMMSNHHSKSPSTVYFPRTPPSHAIAPFNIHYGFCTLENSNASYNPQHSEHRAKKVKITVETLYLITIYPIFSPIVGSLPVDAIFGPVMWRHQGHPFLCVLACKTRKACRGLAGGASSDD